MKKLFSICLLTLALAGLTHAQSQVYENIGDFESPPSLPPQIDAITFTNSGTFNIEFNSITSGINTGLVGVLFFSTQLAPFDFSDVQFYTNRGTMACDTGFKFDNAPSANGPTNVFRGPATTFGNANTGQILAGSASNTFFSSLEFFAGPGVAFSTGTPNLVISATNVVNTGVLDAGSDGLIQLNGNNLYLARGTVHVEGFDDALITTAISDIGIMDEYWGNGKQTNVLEFFAGAAGSIPGNLALPFPASPFNNATNTAALPTGSFVAPSPFGTAFVNETTDATTSNLYFQVVYINTNLAGISTDVRFIGGQDLLGGFATPLIQWQGIVTNYGGVFGVTYTTNYLYLSDQFGSFPTNYLITNNYTLSGVPQPQPYNYTFYRAFTGYTNLPHGDVPFSSSIYNGAFPATNAYATYGVLLAPVTTFPDPTLPDSTVTNIPGRIEINASSVLDLTRSKITGPNFLLLNSTNHFVGCSNASIISPYMSINLGSTNGMLDISNLVAPVIPRFTGPIDMWSGRWTNVVSMGVTNFYHVLIVNAQLSPTSEPLVLDCALRSPNVVVSDILNIDQTLLINANTLTITSNAPGSANPLGEINILSSDIIWSKSFPVMQSLTNFGLISTLNTTYFEQIQQPPYYPTTNTQPYLSFVNHGLITSSGNLISANYFENTGVGLIITNSLDITTTSNLSALIYSSVGPIDVDAGTALMNNGSLQAFSGDMSITSGSLSISNHALLTSGALTLTVNTLLTDLGTASSNFWSVGDGMNLTEKPASGDLLGTTITNFSPAGLEVDNTWAGTDVGASVAGFANNAALGHLILDGGDITSQFYFAGPDMNNKYALYVDLLELRDGATNRADEGGIPTFTAFDMADNMTIYYADAVIPGGIDISEKLNGANDGHLVWVPAYAGAFSGTNMVSPAGVAHRFNRALVNSTDIDSSGDGVANAFNPNPIYTSENVNLTIGMTNSPTKAPVIQWAGLANSTNFLYYTSNLLSTNWVLVTNFVQGPVNGTVSIIDQGRAGSAGFYKVQVNAQQP